MGTTVTSSLGTFVTSRRKEIVLLVLVVLALFALVAMVGWRASDPTLLRPGPGTVENPCGFAGANLADLVFVSVGLGGWLLVPLVAVAVLEIAGRRVMDLWQWVGSALLVTVVLAGFELALGPWEAYGPGGLVGSGIARGLATVVGTVGAWILLVGSALLLVTLLARIRWSTVFGAMVRRIEVLAPRFGAWLWTLVRGAGTLASKGARGGVSAVGSGGKAVGQGIGGLGRRMWASIRRTEIDDEDDVSEEIDVITDPSLWEESILSEVAYTDEEPEFEDGDTVVGGNRALVEAEWEPTQASQSGEVLGMFPDFAPRSTASGPGADTPRSAPVRHSTRLQAPPSVVEATGPSIRMSGVAQPATSARASAPVASVAPPAPRIDLDDDSLAPSQAAASHAPSHVAPSRVVPSVAQPAPAQPMAVQPGVREVQGPGVSVRHNELLDQKVADDGRALRQEVTFELPALALLDEVPEQRASYDEAELRQLASVLEEKLASFKVIGKVTGVLPGPVVTIFEFLPEPGIKVSKIAGLSDDLAMALKALRVRIVAPIPGRGVVGIEIPSKRRLTVFLREVLASDEFRKTKAALPCVMGKDVEGRPVVADLARMPHLLIGGTTGSGKSVGVNGMLMSMLYTNSPADLRLLLVDPKMLEFELYSDIPHLLHPVVTDAKVAAQALAWACREMDDRYALLARWGTRNIVSFNKKVERESKEWTRQKARKYAPKDWPDDEPPPPPEKMPYIVIVVDELADLMMVAGKEVEESICRIAQKARACGIHLIVATQRPSVDVVTGLIKANLPTRIAFQLRSRHDSRTVLDEIGAENLLGKGDMLYMPPGVGGVQRCHGAFVSDEEVARVMTFLRDQAEPEFIQDLEDVAEADSMLFDAEEQDELYDAAVQVVVQAGKASTSMIQRHLKIGYNRAARIIDAMEAAGLIGPADGARPREVLVPSPS